MVKNRIVLAAVLVASFAKVSAGILDDLKKSVVYHPYLAAAGAAYVMHTVNDYRNNKGILRAGTESGGTRVLKLGAVSVEVDTKRQNVTNSLVNTNITVGLGESSLTVNSGHVLAAAGVVLAVSKLSK
jgi:proteasome assembly chaperone (PAC2) family protein